MTNHEINLFKKARGENVEMTIEMIFEARGISDYSFGTSKLKD